MEQGPTIAIRRASACVRMRINSSRHLATRREPPSERGSSSSVIARNVLIGQAAVLVGGNVIGEETIVGAGAVLPEKFSPPARSLVLGVPARVVREARPEDARWTIRAAEHYTELGAWYRENLK